MKQGMTVSRNHKQRECLTKYTIWLILLALSVLLELFFSNQLSYLMTDPDPATISLQISDGKDVSAQSGKILFLRNGSYAELKIQEPVRSYYITLKFDGNFDGCVTGEIRIKDESRQNKQLRVNSFRFNPGGRSRVTVPIRSNGKLTAVMIRLTEGVEDEIQLESAGINQINGIQFRWQRWLLVVAVFAAVFCVKHFKLDQVLFSIKKPVHLWLFVGVILINMMISLFIYRYANSSDAGSIPYPLNGSPESYDIYVKQFDAFCHGHTYIDTESSQKELEALKQLENPYDASQREDVSYQWDHVYYNGHYYSYYGIAPLLTFYFPHYWLTHSLPSVERASLFYTEITLLILSLCIVKVIQVFDSKPTLLTVLLTQLALPSASAIFMLQSSADKYYLTYTAVYCFLTMYALFSLVGFQNRLKKNGIVWYIAAGSSLAFATASRPTTVIPVFFLLLPLYLHVLVEKGSSIRTKVYLVLGYAIPIIIGAVLMMWYNALRFDSPFEFGTSYQLTVSDIRYNRLTFSASDLASYITHYWFRLLKYTEKFPFIAFENLEAYGSGRYMYNVRHFGVLAVPINFMLFLLPQWLRGRERYIKAIVISGVAGSAIILYVDYCIGGINVRYTCDALLVLVMISVIVVWDFLGKLNYRKYCYLRKVLYIGLCCSGLLGYLLILYNERNNLMVHSADLYLMIQRLFEFR